MNKGRKVIFMLVLIMFSCSSSDYDIDLGQGYLFVSESNANQFIYNTNDTSGKNSISCTVEKFNFNEMYIIAKQIPNPDCFGKAIKNAQPKFYIIDKKNKQGYAAMDSLSFIRKMDSLSIDLSL